MPTIPFRTAPPTPPCRGLSSSTTSAPSITLRQSPDFHLSLFGFKPKRFHFLKPCSSLRQTKKQQQQTLSKAPNNAPQSLRRILNFNPRGENDENKDGNATEGDGGDDAAIKGTILAGLLLVGVVGGFGTVGYIYRDQINAFLTQFSGFIEGYGPAGYALFIAVYAGLEILAIPAIPLTMSAGLLFGTVTGTIIVSISGTVAASVAFLIARYFARERILKLVEGNKKFLAIDKAIGKMVSGWLGMLPGTWAYVSAGAFGRAIIQEESEIGLSGGNGQLWTLGLGLLATALAATYVTRLAKDAVKDIE
ncbi:UNVERIFIED_CONTAM: hypothetical protein Sradi_3681600 [Sesamum radiatum]|uniref:VTT domain-containing protein n=1 Tax=Sesamum radiatum TaxID=300843 RepID=A0AAW2PX57_SESRA